MADVPAPANVTAAFASEQLRLFLGKLRMDYKLSAEQLFDMLSEHRVGWFMQINMGVTINHTELGMLREVLEAVLGQQKGLDCWNKEYALKLLQIVQEKTPRQP